jgi:DNA (cytosine-5)-methyltransferase 1
MKYFSMFSGIGGFELGIQQAYDSNRNRRQSKELVMDVRTSTNIDGREQGDREQAVCIGYSEIDKYAIQIYNKHFNHTNYGNATTIDPNTLPDFDLICGGFPCQAFSIAGKRGGFDDTRGTLFFDIARIVRVKRPRLLFLENVKGLLSHDGGRTFDTIIRAIDELGYDCQWQVLNSKNFGVPQNRERVFIIGHLRGTSRPQVFPLGQNSQADIVLPTLTARYYGGQANGGYIGNKPKQIIGGSQGNRVYGTEGTSTTLASSAGGGGGKTGLYAIPVLTPNRPTKRQNGRRFKEDGDPSFTLTGQDQHGIYDGMKIRRLTPTECERLQGYPDGWTEGISDTQRYKTLGNSVTVNVIKAIAEKLCT